jgi:hypothetical protein
VRPAEIEVLPDPYLRLFDRARAVFEDDERVRAMWLGGSLARGDADAASDLDLLLAIDDETHGGFAESWSTWLAEITPTVIAEPLPFLPGSLYSLTPDCARLDVVVEPASAIPTTFFRTRVVVFDRDGLTDQIPPPEPAGGPSPAHIAALITEYFRISAMETILVRDDWLLAREHVHAVGSLVYRLFVESNAPLPPMGLKQWSAKLTPAQRSALRALPTDATDVASLRASHLAHATLFVTNAEVLARRLDVPWPAELEAATARHIRVLIGLDDPFPRGVDLVV